MWVSGALLLMLVTGNLAPRTSVLQQGVWHLPQLGNMNLMEDKLMLVENAGTARRGLSGEIYPPRAQSARRIPSSNQLIPQVFSSKRMSAGVWVIIINSIHLISSGSMASDCILGMKNSMLSDLNSLPQAVEHA